MAFSMTEYIKNKGTASGSNESGAPRFSMAEYVTGTRYKPADMSAAIAMGRKRETELSSRSMSKATEMSQRKYEKDFLADRMDQISRGAVFKPDANRNFMADLADRTKLGNLGQEVKNEQNIIDQMSSATTDSGLPIGSIVSGITALYGTPASYDIAEHEAAMAQRQQEKNKNWKQTAPVPYTFDKVHENMMRERLFNPRTNPEEIARYNEQKAALKAAADAEQAKVMAPANQLISMWTTSNDNPFVAAFNYYVNYLSQSRKQMAYEQFTAAETEAQKQEVIKNMQEWAKEHPWAASGASIGSSLLSGADYLTSAVETAVTGNARPKSMPGPSEATQALRGGTAENFGGLGKFVYHTGMSAADSVVAGLAGGSTGAGIILGLGAASNTANDIKARGGTDEQALVGGMVAGVLEGVFEKISIGELEVMKDLPAVNWKNILGNISKSVVTNASEEGATELGNIVFDTLFMGELSEYTKAVRGYTEQGVSEESAKLLALTALRQRVEEAAASGALMGLFFGAGASAYSAASKYVADNKSYKINDTRSLVKYAMSFPEGSASYQMGEQLKGKKDITSAEESALIRTISQDINQSTQKTGEPSQSVSDGVLNAGSVSGQQATKNAPAAQETEQKKATSDLDDPMQVLFEERRKAQAQQNEKTAAETQRDVSKSNTESNSKLSSVMNTQAMREALNEDLESGKITEEQFEDALASIMELESLDEAGESSLDAYDPERLKRMEVNDNGRSSVPDDGGEWAASQSAGEQAGQLAEGTGRGQSREVQAQRAASRRDDVARYYERAGKQPVNAKEYLGSDKVNKVSTLQEVHAEMIASDSELKSIAEDVRSMGLTPHIFVGDVRLTNGNSIDGLIRGNDVFIRADSDAFTALQNWEHEKAHAIFRQSPGIEAELYGKIVGRGKAARRKLHQTMQRYREAYHGIYDVDENGNEIWNDTVQEMILQEILADAYAGKDTFAQGVEEYADIARDAASQIEERGGEVRGPPEGDFSIGNIEGQNGYYGIGVFLDTNIFDSKNTRSWSKVLRDYVYKNMAGQSVLVYDDAGNSEIVYFARKNDRVRKIGAKNDHKVIDKLAQYRGDNIRALTTVHLDEALQASTVDHINAEHEHQWMDENGWIFRTVYLQDRNGNIYKAELNIANGRDRLLLYDVTNIRKIDTKKEATGGDVPSNQNGRGSHTSGNFSVNVTQEQIPVKPDENFSTGETEQETGADPIEAMPAKAKRVMERAEGALQRKLSKVLGNPENVPEGVLEGVSREISREYLETGTVSDETIDRTFEQVYSSIESEVKRQHGVDVEDYRKWAERDYIAEIGKHLAELRLVKRYAAEKAQQQAQNEQDKAMTLSDLKKVYTDLKTARRVVDKAVARNLLTDEDNRRVNQLLRGDIDLDMLRPDVDNIRGITEVYNAKLEYEKFARQIRRWNAARKEDLRALADKLLATASDWKDKGSGWLYSRETMERNIRDIVPDKKVAQEIIDTLFKPIHDGAAAANRMKNQYRDRVRKLELSRKVEAGNTISEAAAVQLLGEAEDNIRHLEQNRFLSERDGKTLEDWQGIVRDLWEQNPNLDAGKIRRAVKEFREIYDELFEQMNEVRMRNGYEPVNYRKGYFPHFQSKDGDGILGKFGKSLGINTAAMQLPTTINGMTHNFKPGIQWFGSAQQRMGVNTSFDALEGFDSYIEGVADVIFQTDNIQRLRAFAAQVRYRTSEEGIRKQVDAIQNDNTIAPEDKQNRIEKLYAEGKFELGNLAVELDEYTNLLAGKKSRHDRDMEQKLGRRMYAIMKALESRVAANMVAINPGSWLTNFIPITQGAAALDTRSLLAGMWDTLKAYKQDDGFVAASSFLTNRRGSDPLVRTWSQAASAKLSTPMELIDSFAADVLVRSRYNENIRRGMSEEAALADADAFAADVMADRSKGAMPTLFSQTNPLTKLLTQFQLEVNNQLSFVFKDLPREAQKKGKMALALQLLKFALGAYIYDELYEWLVGRRPALDPINLLSETVGDLTGYKLDGFKAVETERTGVYDAGVNLAGSIAEEMPFIGSLLGGGRLPISSALPDVGNLWRAITDSDWDDKKRLATAAKELAKPATYLALPFGGGQVKKAVEGISAVARGGSYSVDSKGDDLLQYPVHSSTPGEAGLNAVRAMIFGKSSLPEAREWVENDFDSLGAKQTALYDEMREGGASGRDVFEMIRNVEAADTNMDKIRAVAETSFDEPLKILAMANAMSESQFEKYRAATNAGVSTIDYVSLLQAIAANSASRGSKSANQEDVKSALNASNLTAEQKRTIWNSYSWKAESPW